MKPGVETRALASKLVGRIARDGAWSNLVVRNTGLEDRDARLLRHLVYGTIRNLPRLDRAIAPLSNRPLSAIDHELLDILRVAFHEVLFGRAAPHAVSDSAVESARLAGHGRAAGFVNALVRQMQRTGEPEPPDDLAGRFSLPDWVIDDLTDAWGKEGAANFVDASHQDAPVMFRMTPGFTPPAAALPTRVPGTFRHPDGKVPSGAEVQDGASFAVVSALGVTPEDRILEIGAAPGGKTLAIGDGHPRFQVAVDIHPRRVRQASRRVGRTGLPVRWVRGDGTRLPFPGRKFDKVLVDAPCTGLGVLRRRPEIRLRVTRAERDRLADLQARLLVEARRVLRPDGLLVYSVCTLTRAETLDIAARFGGYPPAGLPGLRTEHGLLMGPHLTDTDGMFISVIP